MRPYPVFAFAAVLALSACGQPTETEQAEPPPAEPMVQEQAPPPAEAVTDADRMAVGEGFGVEEVMAASTCDPAAMGSVNLAMTGQAGDSYRVTLTCDGVTVAQCTATVAAGAAAANCMAGPNPQRAGPRRCFYGPGNGNSAAARIGAWGCT